VLAAYLSRICRAFVAYLRRICRTFPAFPAFPAFPVKQKEQAYSLLFFKKKSPDQ